MEMLVLTPDFAEGRIMRLMLTSKKKIAQFQTLVILTLRD